MSKSIQFVLIVVTLLIAGCSKKITVLDETTEPVSTYDYYIDEFGNEGIVFYVYNSSYSDLAIVISATEAELPWGPMGETVFLSDTISNSIISSRTYSLAILQRMYENGIERYPAQNWCNAMNHGKIPYAGSWRLPSEYEWDSICDRIKQINTALSDIGGTPLGSESFFWTANEDFIWKPEGESIADNDPYNRAIPMSIRKTAYTNKDLWIKEMKYHVRAIKYILYAD